MDLFILLIQADLIQSMGVPFENFVSIVKAVITLAIVVLVVLIVLIILFIHVVPSSVRNSDKYRSVRRKMLGLYQDEGLYFFYPVRIGYMVYSQIRWLYLSVIRFLAVYIRSTNIANNLMKIYIDDLCNRDMLILDDYRRIYAFLHEGKRGSGYSDIINMLVFEYGVNVRRFTQVYNYPDNNTYKSLSFDNIQADVLVLSLSFGLKDQVSCNIEYRSGGNAKLVENAVLMWDRNEMAAGAYQRARLGPAYGFIPKIKPKVTFNDVPFFGKRFTKIHYDGNEFLWFQHKSLWPPSIDTFIMMEKLRNFSAVLEGDNKVVVDIGSGTGALGIWLASNNHSIKELYMSDWLFSPLFLSRINADRNRDKTQLRNIEIDLALNSRMNFAIYDEKFGGNKLADILVCNPPYLPVPDGFEELAAEQTTMGTELLTDIIKYGGNYSKRVFVSYSHLVQPEVDHAKNEVGVNLKPLGPQISIPFRVPLALENVDYLLALIDGRGLEVRPHDPHGHIFWHSVNTYEVVQPGSNGDN